MSRTVYVNGAYVPEGEATISVFDRGFLFADGVYEVTSVLGEEFCNLYKAIKRDEVETFLRVISPWERDHLLLNV